MIELSVDDFHDTMASNPMVACVLHHGPYGAWEETVSALLAEGTAADVWLWVRMNVDPARDIANMFNVTEGDAQLLVMRDRVVLHCGPLTAVSTAATNSIIDRAARLDMAKVRQEIEQERLNRAALFQRRVCPTARRTRE